jgi:hypothetical protein
MRMTGYTRNWRVTDRRPHHEGEIEYPFAIEHTEPGTSAVMPIADICRQPDAEQSARLISAAPDMYEALKMARRAVYHLYGPDSEELAKVDAALVKAEGKA